MHMTICLPNTSPSKSNKAQAWDLACRLFSSEEPSLELALSQTERDCLPLLCGLHAIKPHPLDLRFVLCPYCQLHRGQVVHDTGLVCQCPDCGVVPVDETNQRAWGTDENWLIRKLRVALDIPIQQATVPITNSLWRIGTYQKRSVVLARRLAMVLQQPVLFGRARGVESPWLITPRPLHDLDHEPGIDATWLPLQERFSFYGGALSFMAPGGIQGSDASDVTVAVHGPFSQDFKWVHLSDWPAGPIELSQAQSAVFKALWHFAGRPQDADTIMIKAGLDSAKPVDLFKVKRQNKNDPTHEGRLHAYRTLVQTHRRAGTYAMACAASTSTQAPH